MLSCTMNICTSGLKLAGTLYCPENLGTSLQKHIYEFSIAFRLAHLLLTQTASDNPSKLPTLLAATSSSSVYIDSAIQLEKMSIIRYEIFTVKARGYHASRKRRPVCTQRARETKLGQLAIPINVCLAVSTSCQQLPALYFASTML
jgi:hypothetical protein